MPRFFFHLFDDLTSIDEEGREFATLEDAHGEAVRNAREMASAEVLVGQLRLNHRIDVAASDGSVVDTVWFRDAVEVDS